ncbi:MAG: O-methyltransferase [Bacteroidetes bacterium]|nr:O-methyltransferase [Bacteroidota bacterium]
MHPDWQSQELIYCEQHSSPEPDALTRLTGFTWRHTINPRQLSGHLQGRFLAMLSALIQPECVLEIGTFTGYSSLCLAEGLSATGTLHTIEADPENAFKAAEFLQDSGKSIIQYTGDALQILPTLSMQADLVFVDAAKRQYTEFLDACLPLTRPGGLLLFDNTLWSGKVTDENERIHDTDTRLMHEFNASLANRKDADVVLLPLRDGLTMVRKH